MKIISVENKLKVIIFTSKCPSEETPDSLCVPIGLYSLKYVLESNGVRCDIIDHQFNTESLYWKDIEICLYDIIGISVTHWMMFEDLTFLHKIREIYRNNNKQCLFIAGGLQATINYKQWLNGGFDLVCLGYAEETLLNICKKINNSTSCVHSDMFNDFDGIAYLNSEGHVVCNHLKSLTNHAFEKIMYTNVLAMDLPYKNYWDFMQKRASGILSANNRSYIVENARLFTTNKCLAKCGFCCAPNFLKMAQGSTVELMSLSPEQVLTLIINTVSKYGAKSFSINDEDFLIGNKAGIDRAIKICNLIIYAKDKGELPQSVKFSCQTRPNCFLIKDSNGNKTVNYTLIKLLYTAGFHNVSLGIETFSDRLLKCPSVNKGITKKNCDAVLKGMIENKLYVTINLILGIPESTTEELFETISHILDYIEKPCQISLATRMLSFPGALIYDKYPTEDVIFTNPINNKSITIKKNYKQHNYEMESILSNLDITRAMELDKFKRRHNLKKNNNLLPRIIISLITFLSIAKITHNDDLVSKVHSKLDYFAGEALNV